MRPPDLLRVLVACVTSTLLFAACAAEEADPGDSTGERDESLAVDGPGEDFDLERERAIKKSGVEKTPEKRVAEVDWEGAASTDRLEEGLMSAANRERLAKSPVPALVPERPELLESAAVTSGEHWYAVAMSGGEHNVHVTGTRLVFDSPTVGADEEAMAGGDFRITRNHGIVTLSFEAHGVAYSLDVECERPLDDERCTDNDYAVSLAESMAVAGGLDQAGGDR